MVIPGKTALISFQGSDKLIEINVLMLNDSCVFEFNCVVCVISNRQLAVGIKYVCFKCLIFR